MVPSYLFLLLFREVWGGGGVGEWLAFTWGFLFCFHADSGVGGGGSPSHDNFCSAFMQMVVVGIGMQIAHPGCPFSQLPSAQNDPYASVTHFGVVYKARWV